MKKPHYKLHFDKNERWWIEYKTILLGWVPITSLHASSGDAIREAGML